MRCEQVNTQTKIGYIFQTKPRGNHFTLTAKRLPPHNSHKDLFYVHASDAPVAGFLRAAGPFMNKYCR